MVLYTTAQITDTQPDVTVIDKGIEMKVSYTFVVIACSLLFWTSTVFAQSSGTGTVAETMDAGAYTYVRLEDNNTWVASSSMQVAVGDAVEYRGGNLMKDFYSPKLDRTFADIIFAAGMRVIGEIPVLSDGITVTGILSGYPHSEGQTASLRARVTKVSRNIMGKNWITLQDGTGTAPDNKLIATTLETVAVGDTVIVKGNIVNDISLGYGYDYKVLLENAVFSNTAGN
jgi:hypothetical protein